MGMIDIAIAFVVLMGLWRGFCVGAIKTAISLVAWLVALVMASILAKDFSPLFVNVIDGEVLQISLAFLAIVLVVISLAHVISWIIIKTISILRLTFLDKILGGILGAAKGVIKVLIIMSVLSPVLVRMPSWQESILAQSLLPFSPVARMLVTQLFDETWSQIQNPYQ